MKKQIIKGTAVLFASAMFVGCSQEDDLFDESGIVDNIKNEYKASFEAKYGTIDPNQSWDFTNLPDAAQARTTRAGETVKDERIQLGNTFWSFIKNDKDIVEETNFIKNLPTKEWNPFLAVELYPCYSHAKTGEKYQYYHLAVCFNGSKTELTANINVKNGWYEGGIALNHNSGRDINTKSLTSANNVYWLAYPTYPNTSSTYKEQNNVISTNIATSNSIYKINYYKEFTLNGHTFWCFDCNNDNDYSDLICLVKNADPVKPIEKRYLIEDLGGKSDFDFNDIVVDFKQDIYGNQKAIIRAMGGTIDFTIKCGNVTWTKSVDGVAAGYDVNTMYNTKPAIIFDKVLAEFDLNKQWKPSQNNIAVTVKTKQNNGVLVETDFAFPRTGEVPFIIAFDPLYNWLEEYVPLPEDWWYYPENTEVTE